MSTLTTLDRILWVESLDRIDWPQDAVFIADEALPQALLDALPEAILVQAGEALKSLSALERLALRVLERRSTRPLTLIAVGGGSVGDAVGFLASVLWRGVQLWHVPTTLLAMVDSAHGGKTAMNLGAAKNQLGTFYPAQRVVLSAQLVQTLPLRQRQEGLAELIKALWLDDEPGLAQLDEVSVEALAWQPYDQIGDALWALLRRGVEVKARIVARDPEERLGVRTWLNLGHTVAHALELSLGLSHGHAVAWGLACAASLSHEVEGLALAQANRLWEQVEPLLYPLVGLEQALDAGAFEALILRDKKRVGGQLRSVLLREPGQPVVTQAVSAQRWHQALLQAQQRFERRDMVLYAPEAPSGRLALSASKSELNRALIIQALRPGPTQVLGQSEAEDVVAMRRALGALRRADAQREPSASPVQVHAGQGGTTLRFLLGAAACRPGRVTLVRADPRLWERPQEDLLQSLRALGAQASWVELTGGERAIEVIGAPWEPSAPAQTMEPRGPCVPVRCDQSSQFASALALIAASGRSLTLELRVGEGEGQGQGQAWRGGADGESLGQLASVSYLQMTLSMLREAGVQVSWQGDRVALTPTQALYEPVTLSAHADESSAACWRAINALCDPVQGGEPIQLLELAQAPRQADRALVSYLQTLRQAEEALAAGGDVEAGQVTLSLRDAPDLAPVLAALASQLRCGLRIVDAAHLRLKESNRIEQLVEAFAQVGVTIHAQADGLSVPPGRQQPRSGATFLTFKDHRLAMAALVLSMSGQPVRVERPMVVAKSYPELWHHARQCGWRIERV